MTHNVNSFLTPSILPRADRSNSNSEVQKKKKKKGVKTKSGNVLCNWSSGSLEYGRVSGEDGLVQDLYSNAQGWE